MVIAYLPRITEQNYESFRPILQDAPATFKECQHHLMQKAVECGGQLDCSGLACARRFFPNQSIREIEAED
jgi:hypothetical protein